MIQIMPWGNRGISYCQNNVKYIDRCVFYLSFFVNEIHNLPVVTKGLLFGVVRDRVQGHLYQAVEQCTE